MNKGNRSWVEAAGRMRRVFFSQKFFSPFLYAALTGIAVWAALYFVRPVPSESFGEPTGMLGPYIQDISSTKASICWWTIDGTEGENDRVTGGAPSDWIRHHLDLSDLKPGKTYNYSVEGVEGSFHTFPEAGSPFKFVVFGDTRSRHEVHQRICDRASSENPLFVVNTGDLVHDGNRMDEWVKFFQISQKLMGMAPYFPVLGNHEHGSPIYLNLFDLPDAERYYSFQSGSAAFIILDSAADEVDGWKSTFFAEEKAWLKEKLDEYEEMDYLFVFMHEPLFTAMESRVDGTIERREYWSDVLEDPRISAIFCGHDHQYHHAFSNGIHHFITGGGGAPLHPAKKLMDETVKTAEIEHYLRVEVGESQTDITAIDINGNIIEKTSIKPRSNREPT
ncbi:MAG: metallophosphoesterase [Candidatus Omnitrophica bacterium]|nr:metallophosphoesterase [Candidatus Omnitrophota bacterium]